MKSRKKIFKEAFKGAKKEVAKTIQKEADKIFREICKVNYSRFRRRIIVRIPLSELERIFRFKEKGIKIVKLDSLPEYLRAFSLILEAKQFPKVYETQKYSEGVLWQGSDGSIKIKLNS